MRKTPANPGHAKAPAPVAQTDRLAEPAGGEQPPRLAFPVVAIGASAGGLEAFSDFLRAMPPDSGMAFVLIQHLPPQRESMMPDILAGRTSMQVHQVEDGMAVEPDRVYVIRPGRTMTISDGRLHLGEPVEAPGHRRPVDDFFRSLAEEQRERAICIVMSGMGSNGTAGAQAVKAVGGVCIAQEPESAKFQVMPRSLIDAGLADFVLRPDEIPATLTAYASHPYARGERVTGMADDDAERNGQRMALNEVLAVLRSRLRLDFGGYKKATLMRRVQRRMGLNQITELADYLRLLRQSPVEVSALGDDLLIHVTGFFRDAEAWETLREKVIAPLVAERSEDMPVRAWVTACSSGEEAYTLAMLLVEAAEQAGKHFDIKVFATDTAERMLGMARSGLYPGGIESEISAERLARFFDHEDSVYRVKKELRELIVFAPQNVLQDPPFSRLDICTCRNLLIYLEPQMQQRLLGLLHFALRAGGALLLGNSETVGDADQLFEPIDKKHRLFRRVGPTRHGAVEFSLPYSLVNPAPAQVEGAGQAPPSLSVAQQATRALLDRFSPPSVAVDRQQQIVYFHGQTERFLDQPRGEPTRDLLALVRDPLRSAVRAALHRAMTENASACVRDGHMETPKGRCRIEVCAAPLDAHAAAAHFLVTFHEHLEPAVPPADTHPQAWDRPRLEAELQRARDELQCTIEELQTSNEEMKASNEEITSINEELQSTNEELETSKEELQSLNEELTTVNAQLQAKMEELEGTTNDLTSLLSSTDIAVIFLDTRFRIRRFTPVVKDLIELIPSDIGRPLSDLALKFGDKHLLDDARTVLDKLIPREREVASGSGRVYVRRTLPYRTGDNRIDGVVITFVDITARKSAEEALRDSEERHRLIVEGIRDYAVFMLDEDGRIATWNAGAERVFGLSPAEAVGQSLSLLFAPGAGAGDAAGLVEAALRRAREGGSFTEEGWHRHKDGHRFWASGMIGALRDGAGRLRGYVKVLRDYTERKQMEDDLRLAKHAAEAASEAKDHFLANVSHELRTPLSAIVLWTKLIGEDKRLLDEGLAAMRRCADELNELIEDLVDTARIEAGKMRLEPRETMLEPLVRGVVESMAPAAKRKSVTLGYELDAASGSALVDPHRLVQVISNLLHNAVKFTPAGGRIDVSLRREGDEAVIQVRDTGRGIAPEFLPRAFDRFARAAEFAAPSDEGLGLGLAIARQVVEMHGGTIHAESDGPGKGSTFVVRLHLLRGGGAGPLADKDAAIGAAKPSLAGVRLFLVEDAADTRRALAVVLRNAGAEVSEFETASAALKAWDERPPALILSDLGLPEVDGFDFLERVREREAERGLAPVPAIAVTAYTGDRIRKRALESGYADCLAKPVDPDHVLAALAAAQAGRREL